MGLWRNIQRLANAGAVQGVVEPGPTDVVTPLQGIQVVDDVSHAVQPVLVPVSFWNAVSPAVVARSAAIRVTGGPRGTLIRRVVGLNTAGDTPANQDVADIFAPVALANTAAATLVHVLGVVPQLARVEVGDVVTPVTAGYVQRYTTQGVEQNIFLAAGEPIMFVNMVQNAAFALSLIIQDIP